MMDENDARAALSSLRQAQGRLAESQQQMPFWRHAAFGLLGAGLVVCQSMDRPGSSITLLASLGFITLLIRSDRKRYGTFVNGWRAGATLPVSMLLMAGLVALVFYAHRHPGGALPSAEGVLAGAGAFAFATGMSMLWQAVYLRDLRRGAGR